MAGKFCKALLCCFVLLLIPATGAARDIFVSPTGDNGHSGSIDAPLKGIQAALNTAQPGDVVQIRQGTYLPAAPLWIGTSGTEVLPIVVTAYQGERVIVDGSSHTDSVIVVEADYITVQNLEIRNGGIGGINNYVASHNTYRNNTIYDCQKNGIGVWGNNWTQVSTDVLVEGNTAYRCCLINKTRTSTSGWPQVYTASLSTHVTFRGNTVYESYGEGIDAALADYVVIEDNIVRDVYSVGIYLDNGQHCTVRRNLIYSTGNNEFFRNNQPANGIQIASEDAWFDPVLANPSRDNTVENNVVLFNGEGFYYGSYEAGGGLINTKVVNNTFYGSKNFSLTIDKDTHSNSVIANNLFYHASAEPLLGVNAPDALSGILFSRNAWFGGDPGIARRDGDVVGDPLLANPGTYVPRDYALKLSSPLRGKADVFYASQTDYLKKQRGGSASIGAFEPTDPSSTMANILLLLLHDEGSAP